MKKSIASLSAVICMAAALFPSGASLTASAAEYSGDNYTITYTINGGNSYTYTNGTVLTTDGDYHFTVTSGTEVKEISFYISSQGTSD